MMAGVRMPPSNTVSFPFFKGVLALIRREAPLSEKKMTNVFSRRPCSSSAAKIRPMP